MNITNQDNENVTGGYVIFTDEEDNVLGQSDVNKGSASVNIAFDKIYEGVLTITYYDDFGEMLSQNTTSLTVKKHDVIMQMDNITASVGESVNLTVRLTDENGLSIENGKVVFKVNGKTLKDTTGKVIYVKVSDGVASLQYLLNSTAGTQLIVQATYSGLSRYNSAKIESTVFINDLTPTIRCEDITANKSTQITLNAWINDGSNVVNAGKVVFKINGKTVKDENGKVIYAKVVNGHASVTYTIPDNMKSKNYTITAVFISSEYERIEDSKTLTVI